jgi:hypothetical protein
MSLFPRPFFLVHAPARRYHSQCRDLYLMALTHNVMIRLVLRVFYRAVLIPFTFLAAMAWVSLLTLFLILPITIWSLVKQV